MEYSNSDDESQHSQSLNLLVDAANEDVMEACAILGSIYEQNEVYSEAAYYYLKALKMSIVSSEDPVEIRETFSMCRRGFFRVQLIGVSNAGSIERKAIDLGLSVKWANCNYQASNIEDIGVVLTQDEAVKLNENGYRLPTIAEWKELMQNCVWEPVEIRGVKGFLVYGKGDSSVVFGTQPDNVLFLPAGHNNIVEYSSNGAEGYYWSSDSSDKSTGRFFTFYNNNVDTGSTSKDLKFSIRLVKCD